MKDFLQFVGAILFGFTALITVICIPFAYFDGSAKSAYLKQTQSLEIPWYQATFLDVKVNSVDAQIHATNNKRK